MIQTTWAEIKRLATQKVLPIQWTESDNSYHIAIVDGPFILTCIISAGSLEADTVDFETNHKGITARRVSTAQTALTNPEDYRFRGTATAWTECAAGTTTDIDITPSATEDRWVSGGFVIHKDANPGDTVSFKVVHPLVGVVETYVPSWLVTPGTGQQHIEVYPARIPAGLILRVSYTNVGGTAAWCGVNYLLHRRGVGV